MQGLLCEMNTAVQDAGGKLEADSSEVFKKRNRQLRLKADVVCPPPDESKTEVFPFFCVNAFNTLK